MGGDELFAGYERYRVDRQLSRFDRIPRFLRSNLLRPLSRALPQAAYGKNYLRMISMEGAARYIDASAEERARRRAADPAHTGHQGTLANVQSALLARDTADSTRAVAPLAKADDAVYIDTTDMPIEQVVHRVLMLVLERLEA